MQQQHQQQQQQQQQRKAPMMGGTSLVQQDWGTATRPQSGKDINKQFL